MSDTPVEITDELITLWLHTICNKDLLMPSKLILYDIFGKYYTGQDILIVGEDGENMQQSGFIAMLAEIQNMFGIPSEKVTFRTVIKPPKHYKHIQFRSQFFEMAKNYVQEPQPIDLANTKFVGALAASRYSHIRLRTIYELDKKFPGDTYLTFRHTPQAIRETLKTFQIHYTDETSWLDIKVFDHPEVDPNPDIIVYNGLVAAHQYVRICNKFAIEVIMETDEFANHWFTEKTAKCLIIGKPFLLMSGRHSLINLRKLGFKTFNDVISEDYDNELSPTLRLKKIIKTLHHLYKDNNRQEKIEKMYKIAEENKQIYKELTKNVQS